jgi:antitoxin HicB
MKRRNVHVGSSLDDFLKEEGILEETRVVAIKEAIAWKILLPFMPQDAVRC